MLVNIYLKISVNIYDGCNTAVNMEPSKSIHSDLALPNKHITSQ